jgi:Mn-containing catalase
MLFGFNAAEVFDIAINIEENGKTFYTKASQMVDNEDVKALFQQLAKEEDTHKARFTELKKLLPPQAQQPTVPDVSGDLDAYISCTHSGAVLLQLRLEQVGTNADQQLTATDAIAFFDKPFI